MNHTPNTNTLTLTIGWLYPDLMSTYGDRGNIIVLWKRCEWRNIGFSVLPINQETKTEDLKKVDMIFGGGSQDREQEIVMRDMKGKKQENLLGLIENNIPALFVCGAPQLMGKYYEPAVGQRIGGLGIFDMVTKNPGPDVPRCIGNIVAEVNWEYLEKSHPEPVEKAQGKLREGSSEVPYNFVQDSSTLSQNDNYIVGFENHGGRTYLGDTVKPFAKVIKGYGNNGEDKTEGVVYKNAIGCYFHGPLLPKNPYIADYLIRKALEVKYDKEVILKSLDDSLEQRAHQVILKKLGVTL